MNKRFTLEAGALVRGEARRAIRAKAYALGLSIHIEEDRGWLESQFYGEVCGSEVAVAAFMAFLGGLSNGA